MQAQARNVLTVVAIITCVVMLTITSSITVGFMNIPSAISGLFDNLSPRDHIAANTFLLNNRTTSARVRATHPIAQGTKTATYFDSQKSVTIRSAKDFSRAYAQYGSHVADIPLVWATKDNITLPRNTLLMMHPHRTIRWKFLPKQKGNIDFAHAILAIPHNSCMEWEFTGSHGTSMKPMHVKNLSVYGSSSIVGLTSQAVGLAKFFGLFKNFVTGTDDKQNMGYFRASSQHSEHILFTHMNFYAAQALNRHIFDNMGVNDYTFKHIGIYGYGADNYSQEQMRHLFNKSPHNLFSEAIQIDTVTNGASGGQMKNPQSLFYKNKADNQSSQNVEIANSKFMPYHGIDGDSIIHNSEKRIIRNLSTGVGAHAVGKKNYSGIWIHNNVFADTTLVLSAKTRKIMSVMYPIHIRLRKEDTHVSNNFLVENNIYHNKNKADCPQQRTSDSETLSMIGGVPYVGWNGTNKSSKSPAPPKGHSSQQQPQPQSSQPRSQEQPHTKGFNSIQYNLARLSHLSSLSPFSRLANQNNLQ